MWPPEQEAFRFEQLANGWQVGRFQALESLDSVVHLVTTRKAPDVSNVAADNSSTARQLAEALGLEALAWCEQVHGRTILSAREGGLIGPADGLVTHVRSLGLMARSADCPLLLAADPVSGAVGVAHSSWRGTAERIASEWIGQMVYRFGARTEDIIVCICPSAGPCCYEVGQDVRSAVVGSLGRYAERFFLQRDGHMYFDLWTANGDELLRAGVRKENIHVSGLCTICCNDRFFSYRVEGENAGRFCAVIAVT